MYTIKTLKYGYKINLALSQPTFFFNLDCLIDSSNLVIKFYIKKIQSLSILTHKHYDRFYF